MKLHDAAPSKSSISSSFNSPDTATTSGRIDFLSDQIAAYLLDNEAFVQQIADRIKAQITIDSLIETIETQSSPFGSIFLADLQPDRLPIGLSAELDRLAKTVDLSDGIVFEGDDN